MFLSSSRENESNLLGHVDNYLANCNTNAIVVYSYLSDIVLFTVFSLGLLPSFAMRVHPPFVVTVLFIFLLSSAKSELWDKGNGDV